MILACNWKAQSTTILISLELTSYFKNVLQLRNMQSSKYPIDNINKEGFTSCLNQGK